MPKYSIALAVKFNREKLDFEPFSFPDYHSAKGWMERFLQRMDRVEDRWVFGTAEKFDLSWSLILDREETPGTHPPLARKLAHDIETWYLKWSLDYFIEKIAPKQNTAL